MVVLDTSWTPVREERSDIADLRPYFSTVVEEHDLFNESLGLLDGWAEAVGIADWLLVEGVTYWYRMRESLWQWVHERLLWRYTLAAADTAGLWHTVSLPSTEDALIDVVRALGRRIEVQPYPGRIETPVSQASRRTAGRYGPAALRRLYRRFRPTPESIAAAERRRRKGLLDDRFERLSSLHGQRVVVLTLPSSYQRIGADERDRQDPNLGSVIPALRQAGLEPIVVGWSMDRNSAEDWAIVERDDDLLPAHYIQARWARPEDDQRAARAVAAVRESLGGLDPVPLDLDGLDLGPALVETIRTSAERLIRSDVHELARVERFFDALHPSAVLMTQEGRRTPWLVAGARIGVPTFALQHGVLYPAHPGYADRRHPSLVLPSCTFVFGEYERRVLEGGAYRPEEVSVSGSPRLDLDAAAIRPDLEADWDSVRRELGVADGDRMLLVSTLNVPWVRRSHLIHMLARLLGGPLPGLHVTFKLHPGERDEGPYRQLLTGLAHAGGYEAPPITVIRDIDLYRLLRAADAHLGLTSTVLTDAVVAGTCNLIAVVEANADLLGYVAAGVARPIHDIDGLRHALANPRAPEPDARAAFLEDHFRAGGASDRIATAIRDAVRESSPAPAVDPR